MVLSAVGRLRNHVLAAADDSTNDRLNALANWFCERAALVGRDDRHLFQFKTFGRDSGALLSYQCTGGSLRARDALRAAIGTWHSGFDHAVLRRVGPWRRPRRILGAADFRS